MKTWKRFLPFVIVAALGASAALPETPAQQQLDQQIKDVQKQLDLYATTDYLDSKYHAFFQDKLPPLLQQKLDLLNQRWGPSFSSSQQRTLDLALLAMYDDNALKTLQTLAAEKQEESRVGIFGLLLVDYWHDPTLENQSAILKKAEDEALKFPNDSFYAMILQSFANLRPATDELAVSIDDFIATKLHSPVAVQYRARPNKIRHPLRIFGSTLQGKNFSSSQWKGKVILVDFWASWCPHCVEEMPRIIKMFQQYHAQGLEVVGVSSDVDRQQLMTYLQSNPEVTWPQLFSPSPGAILHPLTKAYNAETPQIYLIDRNGILRTMSGRQNMEQIIPTLLAESPTVPATQEGKKLE